MTIKPILIAGALAASLGGCETLEGAVGQLGSAAPTPEAAEPAPLEPVSTIGDRTLSALSQSQIPEGKCGMILWTLTEQKPVPVFRYIAGEQAEINLGTQPVVLTRLNYEGASSFGVYETQRFNSVSGLLIDIEANFGAGFEGGAYLERGVIKIEDSEGWQLVAPAAGIAGCRT